MQNESTMKTKDEIQTNKSGTDRRKRINRIKTIIIIIGVILMLLPTISCIVLSLQVSRLQKQVDELVNIHGQYGLSDSSMGEDNYAYAAVKSVISSGKTAVNQEENHDTSNIKAEVDDDIAITDNQPDMNTDAVGTVSTEAPLTNIEQASSETDNNTDNEMGKEMDGEDNTTVASSEKTSESSKDKVSKDNKEIKSLSTGLYRNKKVYLTFDDGPSDNTNKILDILAEYNVKATFFVIGKTDEESLKIYQRIVEEGHTLGMHSYTHVYDKIYNSVEDFDKDFTKLWKLLYDTTGYKPSIFRFPGGSDNRVNKNGMEDYIKYLNKASVVYFDWNVLNGDATGVEYTKEQLIDNVVNGVAGKETSIVLMHDSKTKETTVDSLPGLLDVLVSGGAELLPLNEEVTPIQMIKADSIK